MIDLTFATRKNKTYGGANGNKICVEYDKDLYMVKFPKQPSKKIDMSYTNSCVSEYIGCKIYKELGIPVQETFLATYTQKDKKKIVVACKDMTSPGIVLQDFASLKNTIIDSENNGYGKELKDILLTIEEQTAIDSKELKDHFWNMFIIDAFIGNFDRHNGNWGFLYNALTDQITIAPIYDCGSSLFPQANDEIMQSVLEDKEELNARTFIFPTSALTLDGVKINYFDFISSLQDADCNNALKRITPRINMSKIFRIIEQTPSITLLQKDFYKTILKERKERILDFSLNKLKEKEQSVFSEIVNLAKNVNPNQEQLSSTEKKVVEYPER